MFTEPCTTPDPAPPSSSSTASTPRTGRPRIIDEGKRLEICSLIAAGCDLKTAAQHVGCSMRTIRREASRNPGFLENLRRSANDSEVYALNMLKSAAAKNWRAAAWLLERTKPERFARQRNDGVKTEELLEFVGRFVTIILNEVEDEEMRDHILYEVRQVMNWLHKRQYVNSIKGLRPSRSDGG
jgi:hypothetical protein